MIGSPSKELIEAIIETIPVEISALDINDEVLMWNKHETRIFKRPEVALGRNVRKCHPEKSLAKVIILFILEIVYVHYKKRRSDNEKVFVFLVFVSCFLVVLALCREKGNGNNCSGWG